MNRAIPLGLTALLTITTAWAAAPPERQDAPQPAASASAGPPATVPPELKELSPDLSLDLGGGVTMKLRLLPAGKFLMGSSNADKREGPPREVTLSRPFYLGICEVTQAQWKAVMGTSLHDMRGKMKKPDWPLRGEGDDYPMYYLYWKDATQFCQTLSEKTKRTVRLPTEAEWEYACRAGTTTAYYFGDDNQVMIEYGWLKRNSQVGAEGRQARPVATRKPNAWGLYDMAGNVWEYCQDWYDETYYAQGENVDPQGPAEGTFRVVRGSSWFTGDLPRSTWRVPDRQEDRRGYGIGFRVVIEP